MNKFLIPAFLFASGSVLGWVLELFFRKFFSKNNPDHRWINPGFCVGPYVPLYGCGLTALYLMTTIAQDLGLTGTPLKHAILFLLMAAAMTLIEYIAGIMLLNIFNMRLWDYSKEFGNIRGLICPKFALAWALLCAIYYFFVNSRVQNSLEWLADHLAFSFFIGLFFGVFIIDVVYSGGLVAKMRAFAKEHEVVLYHEQFKHALAKERESLDIRKRFFLPFKTSHNPLSFYLKENLNNSGELFHKHYKKGGRKK